MPGIGNLHFTCLIVDYQILTGHHALETITFEPEKHIMQRRKQSRRVSQQRPVNENRRFAIAMIIAAGMPCPATSPINTPVCVSESFR